MRSSRTRRCRAELAVLAASPAWFIAASLSAADCAAAALDVVAAALEAVSLAADAVEVALDATDAALEAASEADCATLAALEASA